jgi:chitosanase
MNLTPQQKSLCEHIVNVFETGSIEGDYSALVTMNDGPHGVRQVTYGRSQTTEYGNLEELVQMYVDSHRSFGEQLRPYLPRIGVTPLADDSQFKQLLRGAGRSDPVMREVQDVFFDKRYYHPALAWATENGFTLPLSVLVIYDSQVHSGGISQYIDVRHDWLANHSNELLRRTVYRTQCFRHEIGRDNWDLSQLPIDAHGVAVGG